MTVWTLSPIETAIWLAIVLLGVALALWVG
jgi:hypothetical protein